MITYKLKRKTKVYSLLAPFTKTVANFNNMKTAFNAGNKGQAIKSGLSAVGRGTIGLAKVGTVAGLTGAAITDSISNN